MDVLIRFPHRWDTNVKVDGKGQNGLVWGMGHVSRYLPHWASCEEFVRVCMRVCVRALCMFVCFGYGHVCRIRYIRHFIYSLGILAYETLFPHLWNMWVRLRVPAALVSSTLLLLVVWRVHMSKAAKKAPGS